MKWKNGPRPNKPPKYLPGMKFHYLTIIERLGREHNYKLRCQCDCGKIVDNYIGALTTKKRPVKSCGCMRDKLWTESFNQTKQENTNRYLKSIKIKTINKEGRCQLCESVSNGICNWCKSTYVDKKQKGYYLYKKDFVV